MIETLGLFWRIVSRTVWCPSVFFFGRGGEFYECKGTSTQNIPFCCWLWGFCGCTDFHIIIFTLQKRNKCWVWVFFCQMSLWVFFMHTTPTYHILKVCTSFIDKCVTIIFFKPWLCHFASWQEDLPRQEGQLQGLVLRWALRLGWWLVAGPGCSRG